MDRSIVDKFNANPILIGPVWIRAVAISMLCVSQVAVGEESLSEQSLTSSATQSDVVEPVVSDSSSTLVNEKTEDKTAAVSVVPVIVKPRPLFQHSTYPAAWKAAQQSNRPILVFVSMPNCHYCVKMKQQVYQQPHVKDLVANSFETIKADRFAHPKLISSLKVRLYPTTVLVGPNNKILDVIEGYADANKFQRRLQTGIASAANLASATKMR